jgi:hypothetical protein
MNSIDSLRNFCPEPSSFDLEWLEPVVEAGVTLRPFRMTTFQLPDGPVRTYGMVGFPEGLGPFPAILHIHGGCQTVSRGNLLYNIPQTGLTLSSTPICLSMPRAKAAPDPVLFGAPNRLDGWGFQNTIEPAAAGSMAGETVIDENGLTIRSDCERRLSFLFFGMNRPESRPPAGVDTLVVELEGCNWPGLACVAGASYEWKVEYPADGVHRLTADQFRDSHGAPLSGFDQVAYMVAWPLPRPGASARIRRMAWDISSDWKVRT